MTRKPNSALILVGHGSTVNPDSSAPTWAHAEAIRREGVFGEVQVAFWKEEPGLRQVLDTVESDEIYVVPNFISEGYFTQKVIPRELQLDAPLTVRGGRTIKYCEPVGNHARMTEVLLHRAAEVAPDAPPEKTSLLIVGHGTALNDNSAVAVKRQVRRIAELGRYAEVLAAYMEEPPLVADWAKLTSHPYVVVVPFFVADGLHSYQDIPVLLGIESETGEAASRREVFRRNPHRLAGRELYYASAIGTEPLFAEVILDQAAAFDEAAPAQAQQVPRALPGRIQNTLEAWLTNGGSRFGEIAIRHPQPGLFLLTHWEDAARGEGELERFTRPEEARKLATCDDAGEFRPLKTAPSLRHGWRLELHGTAALSLALEGFYPAAQGVAAAFRDGRLETTPLRETLNRQSGMYAVTKKLTDEGADRLVGSFCRSDGGCLKTILWPLDAGRPVTTLPPGKFDPAGEGGAFPLLCNEACNLLVAAARTAVKQES